MLLEIDIRDLAIIDRVTIRLGAGLNVLTGETGAGKSIVVDAAGLLLGARADPTLVRAGADRGLVQGVFDPGPARVAVETLLAAYGAPAEDLLLLDREVMAAGRSTARVNGRVVPVRALEELGRLLVDLHGQGDTAALRREADHIDLLDAYADLLPDRGELAAAVSRLESVRRGAAALRRSEAELARRVDALRFQLEEIRAAKIAPSEEDELRAERVRLANAERLAALADEAYRGLRGSEDVPGATDLALIAGACLGDLSAIDPTLDQVGEAVAAAAESLDGAARTVRGYRDAIAFSPERLEEVEGRLARLTDLKRKYGASLDDVLAYATSAEAELGSLEGAGDRLAALDAEADGLLSSVGQRASELSNARREASRSLASAVIEDLAELGLERARFEVSIERDPDPDGAPADGELYAFDSRGIDRVAFQVSTNPGEPEKPLARIASGGETARIMLALKSRLTAAGGVPTVIFDEIDAGIGGRVGAVVGRKLWRISAGHQVVCVTHLAQVAAFADAHFQVRKDSQGGRTVTLVERLEGSARGDELMHMLGTQSGTGRVTAEELLNEAEVWKKAHAGPPSQSEIVTAEALG